MVGEICPKTKFNPDSTAKHGRVYQKSKNTLNISQVFSSSGT